MKLVTTWLLASLLATASAHFQLQYPAPRGPFVEDQEPTFCDGYTAASNNRSQFPLSGGFISINSEHPKFTFGVLVSTAQNPTSFSNFSQAVNFTMETGEGPFCLPIDLSTVSGLASGQNVTLQAVFDGGDGQLYQCADVTLSNSFTVPTGVKCENSTTTGSATSTAGPSSGSTQTSTATPSVSGSASGAPAPSGGGSSSDAGRLGAVRLLGMLGVVVGVQVVALATTA